MWYNCLTLIGLIFGHLLWTEHYKTPLDKYIIIIWPILSLIGLVFTEATPLFYFMTMVTVGWGMREITLYC